MKIDIFQAIEELNSPRIEDINFDDEGSNEWIKLTPELEFALNMAVEALERTRWIPVSERLPTKDDANSKGKIIAWCTSFNGTEVDLNWRLVETSGVITHWRVGMEPPKGVE